MPGDSGRTENVGNTQQAVDASDLSDLIAARAAKDEYIGAPTSDVTTYSPPASAQYGTFTFQYRTYEHGVVVASDAYGAFEMPVDIFNKWLAVQSDTDYYGDNVMSVIGLPIGDWLYWGGWPAAKFERGLIVNPNQAGALAVYGPIYERYLETAEASGTGNVELGMPLDKEYSAPNLGRYQSFQAGEIYWGYQVEVDDAGDPIQYPDIPAFEMTSGPLWDAWLSPGRGWSPLRYPTSSPYPVLDDQGQMIATAQDFQLGRLYQDSAGNITAVAGGFLEEYSRVGGPTGYPGLLSKSPIPNHTNTWMGIPTGSQSATAAGTYFQQFQNGVIATADGSTYYSFMNGTFHVGVLSSTAAQCAFGDCSPYFPDWTFFVQEQVKQDPNEPGAYSVLFPPELEYGHYQQASVTPTNEHHLMPTFTPDVNYKIDFIALDHAQGTIGAIETLYNIDNLWNRTASITHTISDPIPLELGGRVEAQYEIQSHEPYDASDPIESEWWSFHNWTTDHLSKEQYTATYSDAAEGDGGLFYTIFYNRVYKTLAKKGNCFGMALLAIESKRGINDYPEPIFNSPFYSDGADLDVTKDAALAYDIGIKQGYQLGYTAVNYYLNAVDHGTNHNPNAQFALGQSLQARGEPSIVSLTADELFKYGHSVLALDYESGAACEAPFASSQHCSKIHILNPNTPAAFLKASQLAALPGPVPASLSFDQYILIDNDHNRSHYLDPSSTHEYSGDSDAKHGSLIVTPYSVVANRPRTPVRLLGRVISEGIKFIVGDAGNVTQVSDSDGNTLFDSDGANSWSHVRLGHGNALHVAPIPLSDDSTIQFFAGQQQVGRTHTYSVTAAADAPSGSTYTALVGSRLQTASFDIPGTPGASEQITVSDIDTDIQKIKLLVPANGLAKAVNFTMAGTNDQIWTELDNVTLQPSQSIQTWVEKGGQHLIIVNDGASTSGTLHAQQGAGLAAVNAGVVSIPNGRTVIDIPTVTPFSPANLSPVGWYVATAGDMTISNGGVSQWNDHSGHGNDVAQTNYYGRPTFNATGWNGTNPTVTFNGGNLLRRTGWTGTPSGASQAFSVLGVVRSAAPHNGSIVAWWADGGANITAARASVVNSGGNSFVDLARDDDIWQTQRLTTTNDIGSGRHVIAWRYSPDTMQVTVDGTNYPSGPLTAIRPLDVNKLMVGARTDYSWFFQGDISELVIVPSSVSDADVTNFQNYAQCTWGGLPGPACSQ